MSKATTVWIDTDVAIGSPFREVDDAFALLLTSRSTNLRIAGISTTYGNAPLTTTTAAAQDLVSRINPRLSPIYPGARSRRDLGRETAAAAGLAAALGRERNLTYIALGPLTNLATFQLRHRELARRISRVIFLGGMTAETDLRFGAHRHIRIHDANVVKDPEAVRQILRARIPITLVPIAAASHLRLNGQDLDTIGRNSEAGRYLRQKSRFWLWFWTKFLGTAGAPVFDAGPILAASAPGEIEFIERSAAVNSGGMLIVQKEPAAGRRKVSYAVRFSKTARASVLKALQNPKPR